LFYRSLKARSLLLPNVGHDLDLTLHENRHL
jgi:hypothetical protein